MTRFIVFGPTGFQATFARLKDATYEYHLRPQSRLVMATDVADRLPRIELLAGKYEASDFEGVQS